ncbi:MAG: hypothetical protein KF886_24615 [Candidatus Hydrogenedentes bacterium]|nr:hypothetical protein [Candidatus Hydrogenedentota bacterium]
MAKYLLTITQKGGGLTAEMRTAMFEKLKFTVKKEKEVGKVLNLRGTSTKTIDNDLMDKAIREADAKRVIAEYQIADD